MALKYFKSNNLHCYDKCSCYMYLMCVLALLHRSALHCLITHWFRVFGFALQTWKDFAGMAYMKIIMMPNLKTHHNWIAETSCFLWFDWIPWCIQLEWSKSVLRKGRAKISLSVAWRRSSSTTFSMSNRGGWMQPRRALMVNLLQQNLMSASVHWFSCTLPKTYSCHTFTK